MNLLAKNKFIGALLLGLVFIFSCEELGPFGLGEDDIAPLEFITTEVSTTGGIVLNDSIISRGVGTILTGARNEVFGQMTAKAYTGFFYDQNNLRRPSDEAVLDSVRFNIRFNYRYADDGVNAFNLKAYQIEGSFPDTVYVTSSAVNVSNTLISESNLNITRLDSTYSLLVSETWSNTIFDALGDAGNPIFQSLENFRTFFPGLAIQSDDPLDNIYGLETEENIEIRFYYNEPSPDGSGLRVSREFALDGSRSPHFYSLDSDRAATPYSQVQDPAIEYTPVDKLLVHAGAGITPKIDISGLADFTEQEQNSLINLVEFTIGPIEPLPNGVEPPTTILLYFTDDQNTTIRDGNLFRGIQRDAAPVLTSQAPVSLIYDRNTRTYKNSVTTYVQNYYNNFFRRDFILLYPAVMNSSANGFEVAPENVNLKIFYSQLR
jgi:hypothetical protein